MRRITSSKMSKTLIEVALNENTDEDMNEDIMEVTNESNNGSNDNPIVICSQLISQTFGLNEREPNDTTTRPKRSRVSKTIEDKLTIIKWYNENGRNQSKTAKEFGIKRESVGQWLKKESTYRTLVSNTSVVIRQRRRALRERKLKYPEVDNEVKKWFDSQRNAKLVVTSDGLKDKAMEVSRSMSLNSFKASWGWLRRFLERNKMTSRTLTTVGQKIPLNAREISHLFFQRVDKFRAEQNDDNYHLLNMDEMPMYFDSPQNRTYDMIGNRTVAAKTTGCEKLRFTLILCASDDGRKCMPTIIFKGLKNIPKKQKFPKGIQILVSSKGSVNRDLMNQWRTRVYCRRPGGIFLNTHLKRTNGPKYRSLLVLDSATAHRDKDFKKAMAKHNDTKVEIIPGGMTPILQPADISWNRSVKSSVKRMWSEWISSPKEAQELNKKGEPKRPSYSLVADWCLRAWNQLPREQIINSFKYCNMGHKRDDHSLHSKLHDILSKGSTPESNINESTGLTDESEIEELEEVIVRIEDININNN